MMMDTEEMASTIEMLNEELHYIQWEQERLEADKKEVMGRIYALEQMIDARTDFQEESPYVD